MLVSIMDNVFLADMTCYLDDIIDHHSIEDWFH